MSLWFKRACGLSQDPAMQNVMLAYGAIAIPVFEELMALCKISRGAGRVTVTYDLLAQRLMLKPAKIKPIIAALEREELIEIDREESDVKVLVADIHGWSKWNPKDPSNAERQRRHRSRRNGSVTVESVTVTGTEVEEEKEKREPPVAPQGGRARERALYEQNVADYAAWLLPDAPEPERGQIVIAALSWVRGRDTIAYTNANVLMWIRRYAPQLVSQEDAA